MTATVSPFPPPVNPGNRYGYKLNPQRWLLLTAAVLLNFVVAFYSTTMSTIKFQLAINANQSYFCPNRGDCGYFNTVLDTVTIVMFLIAVYPTVWFYGRYELKKLFQLIIILTSVGFLFRTISLIEQVPYLLRYFLAVFSQCIFTSTLPGLICTAPAIAQTWFPNYQRTFITSIILFANMSGQLLPYAIVPLFFQLFNSSEQTIFITLHTLLLTFVILSFAAIYILRYSTPHYPPSASASDTAQIVQRGHRFLSEHTFTVQVYLFAVFYGGLKFVTLWNHSLLCLTEHHLFNYIGSHAGLLIVSGLKGFFILSKFIDKMHKYKKAYRLSYAFTTFGIAAMAWVLQTKNNDLILFAATVSIGFFGVGSIGIMVETAMESVFPVNGIVVSSILFTAGEACYGVLSLVAYFTKNDNVSSSNYLSSQCGSDKNIDYAFSVEIVSLFLFSGFIVCLVSLNARRRRYDCEIAAKLLGLKVFATRHMNAPLPSVHNLEELQLPISNSKNVEIVIKNKK